MVALYRRRCIYWLWNDWLQYWGELGEYASRVVESKFDRVSQFVAPARRQEFLRTKIWAVVNGDVMSVADLAKSSGKSVFVVTAHNPLAKCLTKDENDERSRRLESELQRSKRVYWRAIGADPFSDCAEASFAIIGIDRAEAESCCRSFGQLAYFKITEKQQIVCGVYSRWSLGRAHSDQSLSMGDSTLSMAAAPNIEGTVNDSLKRVRYRGWLHVASSYQDCARCDAEAHLYAAVHQTRHGKLDEHLALVCHQCGWTVAASQLRHDQERLLELWYDHQVALADRRALQTEHDNDGPSAPEEMSARTYDAYLAAKPKIGGDEIGPLRRVKGGSAFSEREITGLFWSELEEVISVPLFLVARQPPLKSGLRPDIVALDAEGHVHVVEVKRDVAPRQVPRFREYANWAQGTSLDELAGVFPAGERAFFDAWTEFTHTDSPRPIQRPPHLVMVEHDFDAETRAALSNLTENDLSITVLGVTAYEDSKSRRFVDVGTDYHIECSAPKAVKNDAPRSYTSYKFKGRKALVRDLIAANLLAVGQTLFWTQPQIGVTHRARVLRTGNLEVDDGRIFDSPSAAGKAVAVLGTCNGWVVWCTDTGDSLAALRDQLLAR